MKLNEIKMSNLFAYQADIFNYVIMNSQKKGYRVSLKAEKQLERSVNIMNVRPVEINDEIVWVSKEEFFNFGLSEAYVEQECFFKGKERLKSYS